MKRARALERRHFLGLCTAALASPLAACGQGGATREASAPGAGDAGAADAWAGDAGAPRDAAMAGDRADPADRGPALTGPVTEGFDPARTRVFSVSLLAWADSDTFGSFTAEGRRDRELVEAWAARGVPRAKITVLQDQQATRAAVRAAFRAALQQTAPGELLWLYFAGHGMRVSQARDAGMSGAAATYFVPYDGTLDAAATCWGLGEIATEIASEFRGAAVLLTADCCYSGALDAEVAARLSVPAGVLASSDASEQSTGAWTFTDCLLDGLRGSGAADRDRDATIRFSDVAAHAEARLAYLDQQRATAVTRNGLTTAWRLGPLTAPPAPGEGETIEVRYNGRWYRAIVLERRANGQAFVRYAGFNHLFDEWVGADRVRAYTPVVYPVGAAVEARWRRRWYEARVVEVRASLHKIHYTGWSDAYDEWVGSDKLRLPGAA